MHPISYPLAILAGGLATRMRPLTETIPKSLLEVAGAPFIAHQLRLVAAGGIQRVVLCLGHLGEMVRDFVGDGSRFGLHVDYSFDGPRLLGTAGALEHARPLLGPKFLVMYGDSYLPCDYQAIAAAFANSDGLGFMVVHHNQGKYDASNVEFADGKILRYSKTQTADMEHIDYGLGGLKAEALDRVPADQPFGLAALYGILLEDGQLVGYDQPTRFYEIGSPQGLLETHHLLSEPRPSGSGYPQEPLPDGRGSDEGPRRQQGNSS
jgi:N-acetyl-alpha-D-muramate 1-phosphate uridylyltransferase